MKVTEEFIITESPATVWEFFEQIDRVARCVPGVEEVTVVDADNSRVRVTQALGPMTATFDVKMRITARDPGRSMEFTAVGRSVRGAAGNVRATHVVRLENQDEGSTRVSLEGDLALGGMLGSVGQKVVAKQAGVVTQSFAETLQRELSGGSAGDGDDAEHAPSNAAGAAQPRAAGGAERGSAGATEPSAAVAANVGQATPERRSKGPALIAAGIVVAILVLVIRRLGSR
jgi:carbon monoxide dehydrogenase subunit G